MDSKNIDVNSIHIFTWPFKINGDSQNYDTLNQKIKNNGWIPKKLNYLEYNGQEARDCFMLQQYLSLSARNIFNPSNKKSPCQVYKYPLENNCEYNYFIQVDSEKAYTLPITSIELHLYYFNVGILFIEAINDKYSEIKDIKIINDYGRRISIPFIPEPENSPNFLCAEQLGVISGEKKLIIDFRKLIKDYYQNKNKDVNLNKIAPFLLDILNVGTAKSANDEIEENEIIPIADDRMFLISLIRDDNLSYIIRKKKWQEDRKYKELLYSIIYTDSKDACCQNEDMLDKLLNDAIYPRWTDYGTLYAITSYSMVCVTSTTGEINPQVVRPFILEYSYLLSLVLAQRMGISSFAEKSSEIVEGVQKTGLINRKKAKSLINLQEQYITFKSKILILEASNQEQGIELYHLMQKQLLIEREQQILDEQLKSLYEVTNVSNGNRLEIIGICIAIIAIFPEIVFFILSNLACKEFVIVIAGIVVALVVVLVVIIIYNFL